MTHDEHKEKSIKKSSSRPKSKPNDKITKEAEKTTASKKDGKQGSPNHEDPIKTTTPHPVESLSENLTLAALAAQKALLMSGQNASHISTFDKTNIDPFHVVPAFNKLVGGWFEDPQKIVSAQTNLMMQYMRLWENMSEKALRFSNLTNQENHNQSTSHTNDKRFADPSWSENPVFEAIKNSYLVTSQWLNDLAEDNINLSPEENQKIKFITKLMTDSFAPSNFLASNPVAIKALIESNGESLRKGMERFAEDIARGSGQLKITQADTKPFEVGVNLANSPGQVIHRTRLYELIQYAPSTESVKEIPLLIFPPWINKFYILDLQPKNSLIRWLVEQGYSVFLVSWVNPDQSLKDITFEDYMFEGIYDAVNAVKNQCNVNEVNTVGYCIGGTLLGCALSHMAHNDDKSVKSATFFTAQHDFTDPGDLKLFATTSWLKELEHRMEAAGGILPGSDMADTFNLLRANDLIWSFYVNNYLLGKDPPPFDLLCWNSDQTRMAQTVHLFYLEKFYQNTAFAKGELELGGVTLNPNSVTIPLYFQAGKEDHIAPASSVYRGSRLFGGPTTYTLAGSGHIAGVVNHPGAQKYQHWLNPAHPNSFEEWQVSAQEFKGSWWNHWSQWLKPLSGSDIRALDPTNGPLKPITPAPGVYVMTKS